MYGGISGGGAAIGLILGGILTQYASWRWTLLINVPIALIAAFFALREVKESRSEGAAHYDVRGAAVVTAGLLALVYGFTRADTSGWSAPITIGMLAAAGVLLVAFFVVERRSSHPLLPVRVILDRNRGGSFLASLLIGAALLGTFLFLTYYLQSTLGYSALKTGIAFLPFSVGIVAGATAASQLLPRMGPRTLLAGGLLIGAVGMALFTQVGVHTSYWTHVLPAEVIVSFGMGLAFVVSSNTALVGVEESDAGVASALVNATQQIGGSLGTALLNTIAASATATYLVAHHGAASLLDGPVHGYTTAFRLSVALLALAFVTTVVLVRARRSDVPGGVGVPA